MFGASSYDHTGGTVATLTWSGGSGPHSVISVAQSSPGHPLFSSATISSGSTPVNGTQYLAAGDYAFYCGVHGVSMSSTLHVTGTPLARPGGGANPGGKKKKCKKGKKRKHGKCFRKHKHHRP